MGWKKNAFKLSLRIPMKEKEHPFHWYLKASTGFILAAFLAG
jgi:hypothetical protein